MISLNQNMGLNLLLQLKYLWTSQTHQLIFLKEEKEKTSTHQHICVKKYNSHKHKNSFGYI